MKTEHIFDFREEDIMDVRVHSPRTYAPLTLEIRTGDLQLMLQMTDEQLQTVADVIRMYYAARTRRDRFGCWFSPSG